MLDNNPAKFWSLLMLPLDKKKAILWYCYLKGSVLIYSWTHLFLVSLFFLHCGKKTSSRSVVFWQIFHLMHHTKIYYDTPEFQQITWRMKHISILLLRFNTKRNICLSLPPRLKSCWFIFSALPCSTSCSLFSAVRLVLLSHMSPLTLSLKSTSVYSSPHFSGEHSCLPSENELPPYIFRYLFNCC